MKKQHSLYSIWAETDKSVVEMMTKKASQLPSTFNKDDSTDDNSDLESLDSSSTPFVAVPKEFRPPLQIRSKIEHPKLSFNENKQGLSNQNAIPLTKNTGQKPLSKNPLLETPKTGFVECRRISNQKGTSDNRKNAKQPENSEKCEPAAKNTTHVANNPNVRTNLEVNKKPLHQLPKKITHAPIQKHNRAFKNRPKFENKRGEIKYQYVKREECKTVKLNVEMPSHFLYENGLKIDVKMENFKQHKGKQIPRRDINKNTCNIVKQDFMNNAHKFMYQETNVKWVSSLNKDQENNDTGAKHERESNEVSYKNSYRENIVKWDSSLDLRNLNTDTEYKTGQNFVKAAQKVVHRENTVNWYDSLNREDSDSDNKGRIEWLVIQEKKTVVSAKKLDGKNHNKHFHDKYLPKAPGKQNEQKPRRRNYNNFKNKNHVKSSGMGQINIPKPDPSGCKDTDKLVHKNDLNHNSNVKHDSIKTHHTDPQESSSDTESFTKQCRISEKNSQNAISSLSNVYAKIMTNFSGKEIAESRKSNSSQEKTDDVTVKILEDQKKSMLHYGREMSDFIIGSHRALSVFISMFKEWKNSRLVLINHFENLERNLKESSKKFTRYKEILNIAKTGVSVAAAIPLPHVSIAARVISVLTGLFSVFLSSTQQKNGEIEDANDIRIAAFRDKNASTELYMYGLQCGQQFEETTKLIEEFHSNIGDPVIFQNDCPEMATFIRGVLEYRPRHRIFYKKFHKCFQELLDISTSEFGKRFCEPFHLYSPDAVDVIGFLDWRFRHEDFNGESVRCELQQIEQLLEGNDTSIKELIVRIQKCVAILQDELKFIEGRMKDISLFEKSEHFGIKTF